MPSIATTGRSSVPSEKELQQARSLLDEVFGQEIASAATPQQKIEVAEKLVAQIPKNESSPAAMFVLWRHAQELAAGAADVSAAKRYVDAMAERFDIDGARRTTELIKQSAELLDADTDREPFVSSVLSIAADEATKDHYTQAIEIALIAYRSVENSRDQEIKEKVVAFGKQLRSRQAWHDKTQHAFQILNAKVDDPHANLIVGRWYWFAKGDVDKALPYLVLGDDEMLRAAAKVDITSPTDGNEQLRLADLWYEVAQQRDGDEKLAILKRALDWYKRSNAAAEGLQKLRNDKRISELNTLLAPAELAERMASSSSPENPAKHAGDAPTSPVAKAGGADNWKPPGKRDGNRLFRSFLGIYNYYGQTNYPFTNLTVPNGNLWTQAIQDEVRGKIRTFNEIAYKGTTKIVVPEDGVYILEADSCSVSINGAETGGSGEVKIRRGVHTLTMSVGSHGQPHIVHCKVSLHHKETGYEVPMVNTWQNIQRFMAIPVNGQRVAEVSGWQPTAENEVEIDRKTLKVVE